MIINIISPSTNSLNSVNNGANVQGDELVARLWVKNLKYDSRVEKVYLNGDDSIKYDVSISFSPMLNCTNGYKILYLQNIFPKPQFIGTVEVYHKVKHLYNNFIFPSDGLRNNCGDGFVCQFATDPELFYPKQAQEKFEHNCCFVGNNIRDAETTEKYILSAKNCGLYIYGNQLAWNNDYCYGKISLEDESTLYSSSKICLNAHLKEHLEYGSFNFRIFNILACKGFIISDWSPFLEKEFAGCMVFTDGYSDLENKIKYYLSNQHETQSIRECGYSKVLQEHTFKNRMTQLVDWIGTIL